MSSCYKASIICSSIFLNTMIKIYDLEYKCRDLITNEVIKNTNSNTIKQIIFASVNLGLDALVILLFIIFIFFFIIYPVDKINRFWKYNRPSYYDNCCSRWLCILIYELKEDYYFSNNYNKSPKAPKTCKKVNVERNIPYQNIQNDEKKENKENNKINIYIDKMNQKF